MKDVATTREKELKDGKESKESKEAKGDAKRKESKKEENEVREKERQREKEMKELMAFSTANWQPPKVKAAVDVHHTRSIKEEIRHVGGIYLCLPFLTMGQSQQVCIAQSLCFLQLTSWTVMLCDGRLLDCEFLGDFWKNASPIRKRSSQRMVSMSSDIYSALLVCFCVCMLADQWLC